MGASPVATRFVVGHGEVPAEALEATDPVVAVGLRVTDTCKEIRGGLVLRTVARETLVDLTGPWLVSRDALLGALDRPESGQPPRDPLELVRAAGVPIRVIARG